jgi:hypothetical protein
MDYSDQVTDSDIKIECGIFAYSKIAYITFQVARVNHQHYNHTVNQVCLLIKLTSIQLNFKRKL